MAIPPRAAPVVLRKSLLLDMPTTPFGISIVESLKVLAFSRRDHTLFCWQFKGQLQRFRPPDRPFHIAYPGFAGHARRSAWQVRNSFAKNQIIKTVEIQTDPLSEIYVGTLKS